jgi:hypothetical protein
MLGSSEAESIKFCTGIITWSLCMCVLVCVCVRARVCVCACVRVRARAVHDIDKRLPRGHIIVHSERSGEDVR